METGTLVRAVHHKGVLRLLTELPLPEGTQVSVVVFDKTIDETRLPDTSRRTTVPSVPAERLSHFKARIAIGGDALEDSEALYD
ncbi:MAG: antitoxin family protein [Anaerolineae bacterium]|nr:antitoxin family protein [Anaerolineae bacterium]